MKPVYRRTCWCRFLAGLLRVVAENVVTDTHTDTQTNSACAPMVIERRSELLYFCILSGSTPCYYYYVIRLRMRDGAPTCVRRLPGFVAPKAWLPAIAHHPLDNAECLASHYSTSLSLSVNAALRFMVLRIHVYTVYMYV